MKRMKASSLRKVLTALMILLILAIGAGFYYGLEQVKAYAVEVSHTVIDADASGQNIGKLQALKKALADSESLVAKANKLFTTDANYQSQGLKDVQKYASDFGLTISNTNFDAPVPAAGATPPTVAAGHSFVITLQSPVSYIQLLKFLDAIEGNLPKMQINSISLERPTSGKADQVSVGDITIVVSTR
jgi:hypothetical protein